MPTPGFNAKLTYELTRAKLEAIFGPLTDEQLASLSIQLSGPSDLASSFVVLVWRKDDHEMIYTYSRGKLKDA